MSSTYISPTSSWRTVVGTFDEAIQFAKDRVAEVDPWQGAQVAISPVMRDHATGQFQWEVMVTGAQLLTPP